jgi:outer membrane protein OmpA-like peptidoglycan-associated protein
MLLTIFSVNLVGQQTENNETKPNTKKETLCVYAVTDSELELMTEVSGIIEFYPNTYVLTLEAIEAIEKIADLLEAKPHYNLVISGHYFESYSKRRNLKLSLLQAEAIKHYFMSAKLDESRIRINGYGESQPISLTNLKINTRVDLSINF